MYRFFLLILFSFNFLTGINAQQGFHVYLDLYADSPEIIYDIELIDDRIFVLGPVFCDNMVECGSLSEINAQGDVLWNKRILWMDIGLFSLGSYGGHLIISGQEYFTRTKNFIYHSTYDGDSISTKEIIPPAGIASMINQGVKEFGDYIISWGQAKRSNNGELLGCLIWDDQSMNGQRDTIMFPEPGDADNYIADATLDEQGNLAILVINWRLTLAPNGNFIPIRWQSIYKYNQDREIIWEWHHNMVEDGQGPAERIEILQSGTILVTSHQEERPSEPELWGVSPNGDILWRFAPNDGFYDGSYDFSNIIEAENGDIIAVGHYRGSEFEGSTNGILYRLDKDGQLIYEHVFRDVSIDAHNWNTHFLDLLELPDNKLILGGDISRVCKDSLDNTTFKHDGWLVFTDEFGCVNDPCEFVQDFTSEVKETFSTEQDFIIYPNPVSDRLIIEGPSNTFIKRIDIYDVTGSLLKSNSNQGSISFSNLAQGMYLVHIVNNQNQSVIRKVLKHR